VKKIIPIAGPQATQDEEILKNKTSLETPIAAKEEKEGDPMTKKKEKDETKATTSESANDDKEKASPEPEPESDEQRYKRCEIELTDQLQRMTAEFDNYRKKNAGEYSRGRDAGIADTVEAILPAMNSIASALATVTENQHTDCLSLGVQAVERQILSSLSGLDVERIKVEPGDDLDPNHHEVMMTQDSDEFKPGKIISVIQQGYMHKGKLLHAAKVIVSKDKDD
jgi:molecular chaperone GrpE